MPNMKWQDRDLLLHPETVLYKSLSDTMAFVLCLHTIGERMKHHCLG